MGEKTILFTWSSFARAAFAVAAEVALLSLIADSAAIVKFATLVTALLGLGALEFRQWIELRGRHLFLASAVGLATIYGGFVVYALYHATHERQITAHLQNLYSSSATLAIRDAADVPAGKIWETEAKAWEDETAAYFSENIGEYAKARFLNATTTSYRANYQVGWLVDLRIEHLRRNLLEIIEAREHSK